MGNQLLNAANVKSGGYVGGFDNTDKALDRLFDEIDTQSTFVIEEIPKKRDKPLPNIPEKESEKGKEQEPLDNKPVFKQQNLDEMIKRKEKQITRQRTHTLTLKQGQKLLHSNMKKKSKFFVTKRDELKHKEKLLEKEVKDFEIRKKLDGRESKSMEGLKELKEKNVVLQKELISNKLKYEKEILSCKEQIEVLKSEKLQSETKILGFLKENTDLMRIIRKLKERGIDISIVKVSKVGGILKTFCMEEEKHFRKLATLKKHYIDVIKEKQYLGAEDVFQNIFGGFLNILFLRVKLVQEIKKELSKGGIREYDSLKLLINFLDDIVKQFDKYIENLYDSCVKINVLIENSESFKEFLFKTEDKLKKERIKQAKENIQKRNLKRQVITAATTLEGLMIQPIETLALYRVVLEKIGEATESDSDEAPQKIYSVLEKISETIAKCEKKSEENKKRLEITSLRELSRASVRYTFKDLEKREIFHPTRFVDEVEVNCLVYFFKKSLYCNDEFSNMEIKLGKFSSISANKKDFTFKLKSLTIKFKNDIEYTKFFQAASEKCKVKQA